MAVSSGLVIWGGVRLEEVVMVRSGEGNVRQSQER